MAAVVVLVGITELEGVWPGASGWACGIRRFRVDVWSLPGSWDLPARHERSRRPRGSILPGGCIGMKELCPSFVSASVMSSAEGFGVGASLNSCCLVSPGMSASSSPMFDASSDDRA